MTDQKTKAEHFRKLHVVGNPVVLFNVWDAGSAKIVTAAGAQAVATSSWAVAQSLGFSDGEKTPLALVLEHLGRIVQATELPVTVDLESGYGVDPQTVGETIASAIGAGAVGCNLEDSYPATGKLRDPDEQVLRIQSARQAAEVCNVGLFINARCDVFFQPSEEPVNALITQIIERATLYARAGADGLFLPGLRDIAVISRIAEASSLPLNILVGGTGPSVSALSEVGVARISYGGTPYADTMKAFEDAARKAYA